MADLYSTEVLLGLVESRKMAISGLLDRYFPAIEAHETENINFDVETKGRRIAPFVAPTVAGKVVARLGFKTHTFAPAYIKDKRPFDAEAPLKRAMGERIGGTLSPADRERVMLVQELDDQIGMITRRLELMASEILRTGKVTVSGDGYGTKVVDFARAAALTPTALASTARWGQSAEDPLANLQTWHDLVLKEEGVSPVDVIMGTDAWSTFRRNTDVKSRLDTRNVIGAQMSMNSAQPEGLNFKGTIDGFNIFTYAGWYVDPETGTETAMWPADIVAMTTPSIEGIRAFGSIKDAEAGFQSVPFWPKSWIEKDPSVRYLLMQSAPLVVPKRPNASLAVDVL